MSELLINLSRVKDNYNNLRAALPKALIAYALKANYDKKILKTLNGLGCAVEVCSEYEYGIAKKNGFKTVIVNGFVKPLKCFLQNVEDVNQKVISDKRGVRLSLEKNSKVGLSEKEIKGRWDCIAFHSSKAKLSDWKEKLNKALMIADNVGADYFDIGGGVNEERIKLLNMISKNLIIEPGRQLVENACELVTEVLMIKDDNVIIDTGFNFFNKLSMSRYEVEVIGRENEKRNHIYRICGPIPTDLDNIGKYGLPQVKTGDKLRIKNCGAYNMNLASDWVREKPLVSYS